jgi:hypothetical protein
MPEGRVRDEGVVAADLVFDLGVSEGAGAGFRDLSRSIEGEAARRAAREWIVAAGGGLIWDAIVWFWRCRMGIS